MIDLKALNQDSLGSSATFESLRAETSRLIEARASNPARALWGVLQRLLPAEANHPLRTQYRPIFQDLSLVSLPTIEPDVILKLLDEYLISYLIHPNLDLTEQISQRLRTLTEPNRSTFLRTVRARLSASSRSLTTGPLAVGAGRYAPATLSNWIAEYRQSVTPGNPADVFYRENPNWLKLDATQQTALRRLFALVALTEKSTRAAQPGLDPERMAVRDDQGKLRYFSHGRLSDFWSAEQSVPGATSVYSPSPRLVADEQARLESRSARRPVPVAFELPEDEAEISHHQAELAGFKVSGRHDIGALIESIIQKHSLQFPDPLLLKRFRSVAEARLKEIRNTLETRDILTRPLKIGGLGLAPDLTQAIIADLEILARQIRDELPKVQPPVTKPAAPTAPPRPRVPAPPPQVPPAPPTPPVPIRRPPPLPVRRPFIQRPAVQSLRPILEDIKNPPAAPARLIGPIEELSALTLEDFRNLGENDAAGSVRKIFGKIALLGQESFAKKAGGIKAWRQSPVYQLYLDLGRISLESGRAIREVIMTRQPAGQPNLTEAEFNAIIDLNKRLRF